jgi:hypothetical protein
MKLLSSAKTKKPTKYCIIDRLKQAEAAQHVIEGNRTQREVAAEYGVSRDAVQKWVSRSNGFQQCIDPKAVIFYESPEGLAHGHVHLRRRNFRSSMACPNRAAR